MHRLMLRIMPQQKLCLEEKSLNDKLKNQNEKTPRKYRDLSNEDGSFCLDDNYNHKTSSYTWDFEN